MASNEDVARLRRLTNEPTTTTYDNITLSSYIDTNGIIKAAAEVWREKEAKYANLVDVTEGSSSRRLSQLRDGAAKLAAQYDELALLAVVPSAADRPRSRAISRG